MLETISLIDKIKEIGLLAVSYDSIGINFNVKLLLFHYVSKFANHYVYCVLCLYQQQQHYQQLFLNHFSTLLQQHLHQNSSLNLTDLPPNEQSLNYFSFNNAVVQLISFLWYYSDNPAIIDDCVAAAVVVGIYCLIFTVTS